MGSERGIRDRRWQHALRCDPVSYAQAAEAEAAADALKGKKGKKGKKQQEEEVEENDEEKEEEKKEEGGESEGYTITKLMEQKEQACLTLGAPLQHPIPPSLLRCVCAPSLAVTSLVRCALSGCDPAVGRKSSPTSSWWPTRPATT